MGIQSLGVGSGLALDDLVTQLIDAERAPQEERLNEREETLDATISGIGSLLSKAEEFQDAVDELRSDFNLNAREPTISHPSSLNLGEDEAGPFTAEASTSAIEGEYDIAVDRLASGTEFRTDDNQFSSITDSVNSSGSDATVEFNFPTASDSFSITVADGATLQEYVNSINNSEDNLQSDGTTPLITALLIDTGTAQGPKVIFESQITGDGNNVSIKNVSGVTELEALTSIDENDLDYTLDGGSLNNSNKVDALNAQVFINNILTESSSNTLENVIPNVSLEITEVSPVDADNLVTGRESSTLSIGNDEEGFKSKINDFIDNYNSLIDEIGRLTRFGESELEDDGALAGDFMVRGLQGGLANLLTSQISGNTFSSIFNVGLSFDDDGKLEISAVDEFGTGSGQENLDDALEQDFDAVADIFTNSSDGVAAQLYDFLKEYTQFSGLLRGRESSLKDEKDALADEREAFELRMLSFEQIQRDKFIALDKTVSSLNSTGSALFAALGG